MLQELALQKLPMLIRASHRAMRFDGLKCVTLCWVLSACLASPGVRASQRDCDVAVYGATPSGIAAALGAAKSGQEVILMEPTARIGGMVTSGLSHADFHSFESLTGAYLDFTQRVESHYVQTYGKGSQQVEDSFRGTFAEPNVNLRIFEEMLAEYPSISVLKNSRLGALNTNQSASGSTITTITVGAGQGAPTVIAAKVFIDASYEGDLMAMAGVPWEVGREAKDEFGESLAPEQADEQVQGYNFRWTMTRDPEIRVAPEPPPGYDREAFLEVIPILESEHIESVFGYPSKCVFKAQTPPLPNGKFDINDVSGGAVRLSLPGLNRQWPNGSHATRATIFAEHLRDQVGLLYFLQHDTSVPRKYREEAQQWGWCRDEFVETNHLPPQLYVREARRMRGQYVFTQPDCEYAGDDVRARLHTDSIACGDYGNNCHGTAHEGPRFGGQHTGEFYNPVPPYQIPYGVLLPQTTENLLVPGAVSASHVGFCALRLEPIWMSLGQAAGHAAGLAVKRGVAVQQVPVDLLQTRLHKDGSATIYVSDIRPEHPDFGAVQWFGTQGGFHGLETHQAHPNPRGKRIHGQYYEAAPGHAARLEAPLDQPTLDRWQAVYSLSAPRNFATRGDWIRAAYAEFQSTNQ